MKPYRALLVDLDGTLADTATANYSAYAAALAEYGITVSRVRFDAIAFGRNWRQFLPVLIAEARTSADPAIIARRKAEIYSASLDQVAVNVALVRLISAHRLFCRTALVTTASSINAHAVLDRHGLRALFDAVITGDEVTRHKPDPEAYWLAADRLEVTPEDCLVIEDSDIGIASAQAFGASVLRVQIT